MRRMTDVLLLSAVLSTVSAAPTSRRDSRQAESTAAVVERGRTCIAGTVATRQRDCEFRVGRTLRFTISGVGASDAGVAVAKSDIDGDFYAAFGMLHHCVIVWPGKQRVTSGKSSLDLAFVSPVNANVYRTWEACAAAR